MTSSTAPATVASLFFCLALIGGIFEHNVDAFSTNSRSLARVSSSSAFTRLPLPVTTILSMAEEDEAAEGGDEQASEASAEEEEPQEDPEVTALKASIAELEATQAATKSKLQYELDRCEEYSKSGYARKVADMENMKRVRSNIASTSKASATAAVLKNFLPIYDNLNTLTETYAEDEFGRKYSELNLSQTFEKLGVTNFDVLAGDKINNFRMKVLESEHSNDCNKDTVLRMVAPGMELEGNVIRAAVCVGSLGAEEAAAESSEGDEAPAEEA
mmetsp:Transcript_16328/g.35486  ORF Transcript_16328/g.35486 Transcript_16328/m.35486 type:complete len:273 (+) Transcript_16328:310-1128(+)|eukprot:CAMPEP_0168237708 /NCGR_PEP_ID=MMETSP0140_2-20121125/20393_1 /TAXON_ID=44445 /ORGANISM="Pseudo-nitzschia australis, Strain 10249 10 AB" /LENGTH=272 /DNA_ID=CAMNT_0008171485 /DNA_START=191 /DNA_END=1009 /DNA_ORIENTATION=+